jgi:hypothetical protein
MEKNGNTLAPGDKVQYVGRGTKLAATRERGEVKDVDVDEQSVLVKFAHHEAWLPFAELERGE